MSKYEKRKAYGSRTSWRAFLYASAAYPVALFAISSAYE
jgi:hypothetical protein